MTNIVQHFGKAVQETCDRDPLKARRLLRLGYHARNLQFRIAPGKLNSAARLAARSTTAAMVAPFSPWNYKMAAACRMHAAGCFYLL